MPKSLFILTIICLFLVTVMFLGGTPSSARGFYYVIWLSFTYFVVWKNRETLKLKLQKSPFGGFITFLSLGIAMILLEETFAWLTVHLLSAPDIMTLLSKIPPYYENNLLLLPGYIIGWYILLTRFHYTPKEFFILVGCFGIFSEKMYTHIIGIPVLGIPLTLVTMLTYVGIILPSYLSLRVRGEKVLHPLLRFAVGFLFPILVSIPFIALHNYLTNLGYIDPGILRV